MSIFCIIVTYNGTQWIRTTLDSLRKSSVQVFPVLIDNASTDGTVEIVEHNYPEVHLIKSDLNLGFGKANNLGLQYALANGAEYVFLMNQDVYVQEDSLGALLEACRRYPDFSVISPIHLNGNAQLLDHNFSVHITPPEVPEEIVSGLLLYPDSEKVFPVKYVNAAAWFMPISTVMQIGGFDPLFSHYGEDEHYLRRIAYHGGKVGVLLSSRVMHDRVGFGNVAKYRKGLYFRTLLMKAMDITLTGRHLLIWLVRQLVKNGILIAGNILRLRLDRAFDYWVSLVRLIFSSAKIMNSRRENRVIRANWL